MLYILHVSNTVVSDSMTNGIYISELKNNINLAY